MLADSSDTAPRRGSPSLRGLGNRRYRKEHRHFTLQTPDGCRLSCLHFDKAGGDLLFIYAHGLFSGKDYRVVPRFVERLAQNHDVMAFDFRGHGESEGHIAFGRPEVEDLATVVRHGRALGYAHIVTIGSSMGGATAIRQAAEHEAVDGVVTVGAFAASLPLRRFTTERMLRLFFATPAGRLLNLVRDARLGRRDEQAKDPKDLIAKISPAPLLLIHGGLDGLIPPADQDLLYDRALDPKERLRFRLKGHDFSLLTAANVERIEDWVERELRS